ncbi:uncharacterized protein TRIADDRAFT_51267 [Trichoplax adhaerens]|uniref:Uncharacterized protein n=1 Tax=Trichoplax adhaerens TaxID=10228 RepID=B3RI50_TRIAD|nr:predicted protein [Trichoplax adhaerens]EDV29209.1 predicted protein [Trichoplax adhaerens]|eukprot:XP_002108411.1 predicted protein [Trichoplax adhaerens]
MSDVQEMPVSQSAEFDKNLTPSHSREIVSSQDTTTWDSNKEAMKETTVISKSSHHAMPATPVVTWPILNLIPDGHKEYRSSSAYSILKQRSEEVAYYVNIDVLSTDNMLNGIKSSAFANSKRILFCLG